ncbi:uncharacterized protein LOC125866050 isoform X1 [Solanum stenotomum]|uniref:uncharacterized protein LOC125866050 isoform X1 n=1 Tax=Solanum stenotomum TaxID=172797 RepID=UPI0020D07C57|nr:uncharacterized protein LOC125866050 isoform X1 [Solanum stenotomum]XP_049402292.1 uncharacterized protein LOC125866050 isoform X1 [Solanum stenotomum]
MVSEALQQSFMATKLACTSSLPWIWVIEALASSSEIDASLLINLVKRTPEISDDLGRNAREMVSLRILESLFVRKNSGANSVASVPGDKVELDPSRDCEDVLRCILLEMSASNLKTATPDMFKWDVLSFIMKKRSILPKCHLQQFKDAIVESTNPFSTSLKERSGLELGNHYRDSGTADAIGSDGFKQGHEIGGVNTRHAAPTENLDTSTQGNKNGLQENQPGSTLLPVKRSFNAPTAYEIEVNKTKATPEKSSDPCAKAAKKFKQDVAGPIQNTVPDLISSQRDGVPAESCGGSQSIVQKRNSEDDGTLEANGCLKDGKAKHAASASVLSGIDSSIKDLLPQRMSSDKKFQNIGSSSNCCAELGTSSDSSLHVIQQDSRTCGSKGDLDYNLPRDLQNGEPSNADKENIEQSCESEFSGDTDEYHNESTDLASQKNDFLNLQYAQGEDSLATVDCTELNLCVKCNEGENLLVCSSDTCSLVVHESCLGSVPNFDYKGSFYCPFCAYSRAISEYLEGKKKASLARNDLAAFIRLGAGQQSKKSLPRSQGMKKHQSQEDTIVQLCRNAKGKNSLKEVTEAGSAPADRSSVGAQVIQTSAPQPEPSQPRNENERNSLNEVTEAGSAPADRSSVRAQVMQTGAPQPETSLLRNESGRNSLNEVREAGSAPADKSSVGAQVVQTGSPQPEASLPKQCLVAGQQPDKSPLGCHRSRQNQSREEEELCHDENRNKNSLEKAEPAGSHPVTRNSMRAEVTQIHPPQPHVPHEHVCQESSSIEVSSEEEQDEIGSGYHVQFRNQENNSCPWIPQLRRKKLPWTKMEEETLKEGLLRFSHFHDRWKRILEFGGDVFQKGRTSGDLKDKWRNISKAGEKAT